MSLQNKVSVVTGAAGAIGSAVARSLAADGSHVILLDNSRERLETVAAGIDGGATPICIDLANPEAVEKAARDLLREFGRVDVLVNNAGVLSNHKIAETDFGEWQRVHRINVDAAFLLSRAVLPEMRSSGWGRLIFMSSYAAKSGGLTAGTAYSVSKASLIGLAFSVARETAAQGITSNAIAPAYVMSPMVSEQLSDEQRANQLAKIPVGRFCTPEEVAHTVSFLASPLAGFITGEVIDMNGGLQFD